MVPFFIGYALLVWYFAARFRRRWGGFAAAALGLAGLGIIAYLHWRLCVWSDGKIYLPVLQSILYPYAVMVFAVGMFVASLPRTRGEGRGPWCPRCQYNLHGLSEATVCPECGAAVDRAELARSGSAPVKRG